MASNQTFIGISLLALTAGVIAMGQACSDVGGGSSSSDPFVQIAFAPYSAGTVSSLSMCFTRINLKENAGDISATSVDLTSTEVFMNAMGGDVREVSLPTGTYARVELVANASCASGQSAYLINGNGIFSSSESITLAFNGNITISADSALLELDPQNIVSALATTASVGQIKTKAQSVSGSF
ncbi:MAG: hypothetical protein KF799_07395 [Bdellovibrionales bacterium]|nr:hypothetical protein [Bdellovibrionales bacterium]